MVGNAGWNADSRSAMVTMRQPSEDRLGNDSTAIRRFDLSRLGRIAIEGEVRAGLVIVGNEIAHDAMQMSFAEYDVVVQALAAKSAVGPLDEWCPPPGNVVRYFS